MSWASVHPLCGACRRRTPAHRGGWVPSLNTVSPSRYATASTKPSRCRGGKSARLGWAFVVRATHTSRHRTRRADRAPPMARRRHCRPRRRWRGSSPCLMPGYRVRRVRRVACQGGTDDRNDEAHAGAAGRMRHRPRHAPTTGTAALPAHSRHGPSAARCRYTEQLRHPRPDGSGAAMMHERRRRLGVVPTGRCTCGLSWPCPDDLGWRAGDPIPDRPVQGADVRQPRWNVDTPTSHRAGRRPGRQADTGRPALRRRQWPARP